MKHLLYILTFTVAFTQSLEVDGDLTVTGDLQAAKIDSLEAVIAQLQNNVNTSNVLFMTGVGSEGGQYGNEKLYFLLKDGAFWEYENYSGTWQEMLSVPFDANLVLDMSASSNIYDGGMIFCLLKNAQIWRYSQVENVWSISNSPPFEVISE